MWSDEQEHGMRPSANDWSMHRFKGEIGERSARALLRLAQSPGHYPGSVMGTRWRRGVMRAF